jgi:hypothetical protein
VGGRLPTLIIGQYHHGTRRRRSIEGSIALYKAEYGEEEEHGQIFWLLAVDAPGGSQTKKSLMRYNMG